MEAGTASPTRPQRHSRSTERFANRGLQSMPLNRAKQSGADHLACSTFFGLHRRFATFDLLQCASSRRHDLFPEFALLIRSVPASPSQHLLQCLDGLRVHSIRRTRPSRRIMTTPVFLTLPSCKYAMVILGPSPGPVRALATTRRDCYRTHALVLQRRAR